MVILKISNFIEFGQHLILRPNRAKFGTGMFFYYKCHHLIQHGLITLSEEILADLAVSLEIRKNFCPPILIFFLNRQN